MTRGWLKGHMARQLRHLRAYLSQVDLLLEVVDARAPYSTRERDLLRWAGDTPRWLLLGKKDRVTPLDLERWRRFYEARGEKVLAFAAGPRTDVGEVQKALEEGVRQRSRPLSVMVAGIPNVGKSSLINALLGRRKAARGARPGITRGAQWIQGEGIRLLDTPGIFFPRHRSPLHAHKLRVLECIGDELWPAEAAALWLVTYLAERYPRTLEVAFGLSREEGEPEDVLEELGRKKGMLLSGGRVDRERAAAFLILAFREGKLGDVILEVPEDVAGAPEDRRGSMEPGVPPRGGPG